MAQLTVDEQRVLELVSQKRSLTREQITSELAKQGPVSAMEGADPVESLVKSDRLWAYSRKPGAKIAYYPVGQDNPGIISFWTLRKLVGLIGVGLPVALWLGNFLLGDLLNIFKANHGIQGSMSAYYYTGMRNVFVGAICAIAVFLVCNRGYDKEDNRWYKAAGLLALGVPFFPTKREVPPALSGQEQLVGNLHLIFAGLLFISLAIICFRVFSKPDFAKGKYNVSGTGKKRRNGVYITCGIAISASIALVVVFNLLLKGSTILGIPPLFLFEFTALAAFGIAWLTKGNVYPRFFKDED